MVNSYYANEKYGLAENSIAPNFELKDIDGKLFDLKEELNHSSVMLNFFRGHF